MKKLTYTALTAAALAFGSLAPANAAEFQFATIEAATPANTFLSRLTAVCNSSQYKLSERARTACVTGNMPRVVKSGDAFVNTGVGAELNTLVRQVTTTVAAE